MADAAVANRYAEAFVNALEASGKPAGIAAGLEELKGVAQAYDSLKQMRAFLGSPEISREQKEGLLARIGSSRLGLEGRGLLNLLLRWERIDHLPAIAAQAARIARERQGLLYGEVVTARPICAAKAQAIEKAVGRRLGKRVVLERRLEPRLLGGVRVLVGTTLIDQSVQRLLEEIRFELKQVKVA